MRSLHRGYLYVVKYKIDFSLFFRTFPFKEIPGTRIYGEAESGPQESSEKRRRGK